MNSSFAAALDRALDHVRASDPHEATRLIQAALAGHPQEGDEKTLIVSSNRVRPRPNRIDPDADDAEIVNVRQGAGHTTNPPDGGRVPQGFWSGRPRRRLRNVIDGLSGVVRKDPFAIPRGVSLPGGNSSAPPVPEGALYEWRSHAGPCGSRDYRLYVPAISSRWRAGDSSSCCTVARRTRTTLPPGTSMNALAEPTA